MTPQERIEELEAKVVEQENHIRELQRTIFSNTDRQMTMANRFFVATDGFIGDENFDFDAGMAVTGDFTGDEKARYAQMIACTLNDYCKMRKENGE